MLAPSLLFALLGVSTPGRANCDLALTLIGENGKMDSELLSAWMRKAGGGDSFAQKTVGAALLNQLPPMIVTAARTLKAVLTAEEIEDITAALMFNIVRAGFSYDVAKGKFSTWAVTAARNEIARLRKEECGVTKECDLKVEGLPSVLQTAKHATHKGGIAVFNEKLKDVDDLLPWLNAREAIVLKLRLAGNTNEEVSFLLGGSEENARLLWNNAYAHAQSRIKWLEQNKTSELRRRLDTLAEPDRSICIAISLDERTPRSVGKELNIPIAEVKARYDAAVGVLQGRRGTRPPAPPESRPSVLAALPTGTHDQPRHYQQEVQRKIMVRVIDFLKKEGRNPSSYEELAEITDVPIAKFFSQRVGPGRDDSAFSDPAAFKSEWLAARERALAEMVELATQRPLTDPERLEVANLRAVLELDTADGLVASWEVPHPENASKAARSRMSIPTEAMRRLVE